MPRSIASGGSLYGGGTKADQVVVPNSSLFDPCYVVNSGALVELYKYFQGWFI